MSPALFLTLSLASWLACIVAVVAVLVIVRVHRATRRDLRRIALASYRIDQARTRIDRAHRLATWAAAPTSGPLVQHQPDPGAPDEPPEPPPADTGTPGTGRAPGGPTCQTCERRLTQEGLCETCETVTYRRRVEDWTHADTPADGSTRPRAGGRRDQRLDRVDEAADNAATYIRRLVDAQHRRTAGAHRPRARHA